MSTDLATLSTDGRLATLTLNRPDARNSLGLALLDALHARLDELESAPDISVVVITGEGRAFCAGMDLKEVLTSPTVPLRLLSSLAELTLRIRRLPAVTVAKVNGAAIGGGCGLATVCDLALTHADSKMGFPEVDIGVCPAVVAPWLVRKIGAGRARAVLLRGGIMTGDAAHRIGIADDVCPAREGLDALAEETAKSLLAGGPSAQAATKRLLNELDGSLDAPTLHRAAELSASVMATPEAQAALRAHIEAR